jgi:DNA-binding response OmpR family regulator
MIITGNMGEDLPQLAIEAGAWDFINKPFSINESMLRFTRMMDYCRHSV